VLAQTKDGGIVAACGNASDIKLNTTVMPFIIRGVKLWGINSVNTSKKRREFVWGETSKLIDFEKEVSKHANNMFIKFGCFILTNKNLLFENNNRHIYLTEPEAHIIKLLFLNKLVKKNQIKTEVLKLSAAVESKSLETHLYRLRKKLSTLSPNISIRSDDKKNLVIVETN